MKFPRITLTQAYRLLKLAKTAKQTVGVIQQKRAASKPTSTPTLERISQDLRGYISDSVNELHLSTKDGTEPELQMLRKRLLKLKSIEDQLRAVSLEDRREARRTQ